MFECVCHSGFFCLYQMRVHPPEEGSFPCSRAFVGPAWPSAPEEGLEVWNQRIVVNLKMILSFARRVIGVIGPVFLVLPT